MWCLCWLGCVALAPHGARAAAGIPVAHGAIIRSDARISFEWPEPVKFEVKANGKELTIIFARKASPSLGEVLSNLYPYVKSAQLKSDGKTLKLSLDKAYKIRTFEADNVTGVDLLDIDLKQRPGYQAQAADVAALEPAAGEKAAEAAAEKTPEAPAEKPAAAAAAKPDEKAPEKAQAASPPAATEGKPAAAAENDSVAAPERSLGPKGEDDTLKVSISSSEDSTVIRLPFRERIDIAAFVRNNVLWVVLGKKMGLNLSDFKPDQKSVIGKPELYPGKTTILRIPVNDGMFASVSKEESSHEWAILVAQTKKPLASPLKIDINTEPPAPPHVFVNTLQTGEAVTIKDPVIGDEMIVVPLFSSSEGMPFAREFVDFTLLESAQGLVAVKKTDELNVAALRNGLRITVPQGAALTPGLPEVEKSASTQALQIVPTLFVYEKWKLPDGIPERPFVRDMMRRIVIAETPQEANELRVRLAQVYLASGMAAEAQAMLEAVRRVDPQYYRSSKLAAMAGASHFLMARYVDAARAFSASELNNNREMDYWRNMLADLNGREGKYNYLELNDDYISRYPPVLRQKLAVVAADRSIDAKEYNTAIRIFETLKKDYSNKTVEESKADKLEVDKNMLKDDAMAPIVPYINYLMAKIAADTGQSEDSIKAMDELAENYKYPFVRSRAEFARIIWEMNRDLINKSQVVERLERLRLAWHGDSLELKVLDFLGDVYLDNKDYLNAMRIWDNAVYAYAGTPRAIELQRKLEETFVLIFKEGIVSSLPPLEALALYYQYKNYAPPGSIWRDVISNLADRLVGVDLLEQGASLLEHQMRHDAQKTQRSQLGAKVA
ncbi:MAG: tetratricopeptide repeat protein, partial [Proteobacteria bacterium]|nr:tetratricopeptide repeat protein [Pseudomonadota bacterium]